VTDTNAETYNAPIARQAYETGTYKPDRRSLEDAIQATATQMRDEGGKFVPKPPASPVVADAVAKPPTKAEKEVAASEVKALQALRRAKVPQSVLDKTDYADRIRWGLELAENQAVYDKKLTSKENPKEPVSTGAPKAEDLQDLASSLGLEGDDKKTLERAFSSQRDRWTAELNATQEVADMASSRMWSMAKSTVLGAIAGEFPELADKSVRAQVSAEMDALDEHDDYDGSDYMESVRSCALDAVMRVCRGSIEARMRSQKTKTNAALSASQPATGKQKGNAGVQMSGDPIKEAYNLLAAGHSAKDVNAMLLNK